MTVTGSYKLFPRRPPSVACPFYIQTIFMSNAQAEVMPTKPMLQIAEVEIDKQIATAKAFPRDIKKFIQTSTEHATVTLAIAESCNFGLPVQQRNEKTGMMEEKIIEGPSVRLAEIMLSNFGNVRAGARVVANDGRKVTAQGIFYDLEKNVTITLEVERSIVSKKGQTYSERLQVLTGNAACSIAFRNAVFKGMGAAYVAEVYDRAKEFAKGDPAKLPERRVKAVNYFRGKGVTEEQIFARFGVKSMEEIDLEMLMKLSALKAAYVNEEATLDELFPPIERKKDDAKSQANKAADAAEKKLNKGTPGTDSTLFKDGQK